MGSCAWPSSLPGIWESRRIVRRLMRVGGEDGCVYGGWMDENWVREHRGSVEVRRRMERGARRAEQKGSD